LTPQVNRNLAGQVFALGRRLLCNGAGALERVFDDTHSREGRECGCRARGACAAVGARNILKGHLHATDPSFLLTQGFMGLIRRRPCPLRAPHRAVQKSSGSGVYDWAILRGIKPSISIPIRSDENAGK
jgi:hypothetical protein